MRPSLALRRPMAAGRGAAYAMRQRRLDVQFRGRGESPVVRLIEDGGRIGAEQYVELSMGRTRTGIQQYIVMLYMAKSIAKTLYLLTVERGGIERILVAGNYIKVRYRRFADNT